MVKFCQLFSRYARCLFPPSLLHSDASWVGGKVTHAKSFSFIKANKFCELKKSKKKSYFIHYRLIRLVTYGNVLSINWPFLWGRGGRENLFFQTFTLIFMCMFLTTNKSRKNFNRISFLLLSCSDNVFNISGKTNKISCACMQCFPSYVLLF